MRLRSPTFPKSRTSVRDLVAGILQLFQCLDVSSNLLKCTYLYLRGTMQSVTSLNQLLQNISELAVEDHFYLADILNKRLIEARRKETVDRVKEAEENYREGNVYSGDIAMLMAMTEDDD